MKKFLEKNCKWISSLFVLIWLYLIIKLFWFWANTICSWWGWYISLCIVPHIEYSWTYAWYISILFLILSIVWIYLIKSTNNKLSKIYISIFVLLLWVIWKPIFYELSDDFKFFHNWSSQYTDKEWNLTNMDLYLESMWKYCDDSIDDFKFKKVYRRDMCGWQYITEFKTAEEYSKALDYANKKNMWYMYKLTYRWAEKFWLEKIIDVYNDDTFYWKVIIWNWSNIGLIYMISSKTDNRKINDLIEYIMDKLLYWKKNYFKDKEEEYKYWETLDTNIFNKIKEIKEINYKIF